MGGEEGGKKGSFSLSPSLLGGSDLLFGCFYVPTGTFILFTSGEYKKPSVISKGKWQNKGLFFYPLKRKKQQAGVALSCSGS